MASECRGSWTQSQTCRCTTVGQETMTVGGFTKACHKHLQYKQLGVCAGRSSTIPAPEIHHNQFEIYIPANVMPSCRLSFYLRRISCLLVDCLSVLVNMYSSCFIVFIEPSWLLDY